MRLQRIFMASLGALLFTTVFSITGRAEMIYGIQTSSSSANATVSNLVRFDSLSPDTVITVGPFTGVVAGDTLRSIDFRPSNGLLYGVSSNGTACQLYVVIISTGQLVPVGPGFTLPFADTLNRVEMEFDPVADNIRILTAANLDGSSNPVVNNFTLDPFTSVLTNQTPLNYIPGDPNAGLANMEISAAAYSNPSGGATTLFAWDYITDSRVRIGSVGGTPDSSNTGRMTTVGLGPPFVTTNAGIGMDFGPSGTLYVTKDSVASTAMGLYTMNTTTGALTLVNNYGISISDISVQRPATAAGVTLSGRVLLSPQGRGIVNAVVSITDSNGITRNTTTGKGGRYAFDDLEIGGSYVVVVRSRSYSFSPQVVQLLDSLADIDFFAEPSLPGTK